LNSLAVCVYYFQAEYSNGIARHCYYLTLLVQCTTVVELTVTRTAKRLQLCHTSHFWAAQWQLSLRRNAKFQSERKHRYLSLHIYNIQ